MKNNINYIFYGLYLTIAAVTSAPFFIKYFPGYPFHFILAYIASLAILFFLILRFYIKNIYILNYHFLWVFLVLGLTMLNIYFYPRTRLVSHPSSAPSALIEPAVALFINGLNPYSIRLFDGAPISSGPGWILLNFPFLLSGLITLLTPTYLILATIMIKKWNKAYAFIFVMLLLAPLNFLQMSIIGHDLPAIALALVTLALALNRYHKNNVIFTIIAIFVGLVATARTPFIIVPIALTICLTKINYSQAIKFMIFSTGITVIIHSLFYFWSYQQGLIYQPLHVFSRAAHSGSMIFLCLGILTWITLIWYSGMRLTKAPSTWMIFLWVVLSIPFIFVGLNELLRDGPFSLKTWADWEGKGYIMFTLPLLVAGIVLNTVQVTVKIDSVKTKPA